MGGKKKNFINDDTVQQPQITSVDDDGDEDSWMIFQSINFDHLNVKQRLHVLNISCQQGYIL